MSPYDRARTEPGFRARFAEAYRGDDDPLDALWWHEHPEEPAPSGAPPAALELRELRRAVYAPEADPAVAARYRAVLDRMERERAAVADALRAAEREDAPAPTVVGEAGPTSGESPVPERSRLLVRAAPALALAAVLAFAAGVLLAPTVRGGAAPEPAGTPTATPTPTETAPFISGASGSGSALGIFGEPQRDVDRPAIGADARLLPQTLRRLQTLPTRGLDIYAAEDADGDVCLVALSVEAHLTASCAPISAFRASPLRLTVRADLYRDAFTKTGVQVDLTATWGFFSRFTLQERPVEKQ